MQTFENQTVAPPQGACASADGRPEEVVGGITLDLTTLTATVATVTLPDDYVVPVGVKFVPFGAVLVETAGRKYQPWDGVAALVNSKTVVINRTITSDDPRFDSAPGACNGGAFFEARLKYLTGGVWTVCTGAMVTALVTAQPRIVRKRMS
jgi:hypothetical protein